jgi:hypothetical protein
MKISYFIIITALLLQNCKKEEIHLSSLMKGTYDCIYIAKYAYTSHDTFYTKLTRNDTFHISIFVNDDIDTSKIHLNINLPLDTFNPFYYDTIMKLGNPIKQVEEFKIKPNQVYLEYDNSTLGYYVTKNCKIINNQLNFEYQAMTRSERYFISIIGSKK